MIIKLFDRLYMEMLLRHDSVEWAKRMGVTIGKHCRLLGRPDFGSTPYLITIGNHVSISGGATFINHEGAHWVLKGIDEKYNSTFGYGRINIKDNVYIGQNVTILRGVTIGENTIVGACSLVNKSLEANSVYAGVPAKRICSLEEWKEKFLDDIPEYDLENYKSNQREEILKIVDKFRSR